MSSTLPTSMTTTGPAVTQVSTIKTDTVSNTDYTSQKDSSLDVSHKEPRDALDAITGPTMGDKVMAAASKAGSSIAAAASSAGQVISEKSAVAGHAISEKAAVAGQAMSDKAHEVDTRLHLTDKMRDAASFAGAALKQGNPIHAMKHVTTASAIGSAERAKHENGPLPEGAHSATSSNSYQLADSTQNINASTVHGGYGSTPAQPTNMEIAKEKVADAAASVSAAASTAGAKIADKTSVVASSASASLSSAANTASIKASDAASSLSAAASNTGSQINHSLATTSTNIGNQASDAAAFTGTALKQGNPVFAAQYASTAATIGQAEREKHLNNGGNLPTDHTYQQL